MSAMTVSYECRGTVKQRSYYEDHEPDRPPPIL